MGASPLLGGGTLGKSKLEAAWSLPADNELGYCSESSKTGKQGREEKEEGWEKKGKEKRR